MNLVTVGAIHAPSVPFGGYRIWDNGNGTTWKDLNTASGVFNFAPLDRWLSQAVAGGQDVLYTFGKVPTWAGGGTGFNTPPSDLDTTDANWKAFVTALVQHSLAPTTPVKISFYELWNEPNITSWWNGTPQQLLTMARDAYGIIKTLDPSALVLSPAGSGGTAIGNFILQYLTACAGDFPQDIFSYHAYLQDGQRTTLHMPNILTDIKVKKNTFGISAQPIWFSEGSEGFLPSFVPPLTLDEQVAYMATQHLFMWNSGVSRYYWYAWDNSQWGTMWSPTDGINAVGTAYRILQSWIIGSSITKQLAQDANGTWTANITLTHGDTATIVWNSTNTVSFPTSFSNFLTLDNTAVNPVVGGTVAVGSKPILLTSAGSVSHTYIISSALALGDNTAVVGSVDGIPVQINISLSAINSANTTGGLAAVHNLVAPNMLAAAMPPVAIPVASLPSGSFTQ
jgi:polysaccharide biosynthesis protein PslG